MFARSWAGLPNDAPHSTDLLELGYKVAENDTVSSAENPGKPFRYLVDKNDRINARRGFALDEILHKLILLRLKRENLQAIKLPLESANNSPHVQVLASDNLSQCHHVVIFFNDSKARSGIIDMRSLLGCSGMTKGSVVALIHALNSQLAESKPGIILANPGQLYWWPEGNQSISTISSNNLSLPSLVHYGRKFHAHLNSIPGHKTAEEHLKSVMRDVVTAQIQSGAKLSVIAAGDGCDVVQRFFEAEENWTVWSEKLSAVIFCGPSGGSHCSSNAGWKDFISKRGRGYLLSDEPLDSNLRTTLGFPCLSSGETLNSASILVQALQSVIYYIKNTIADSEFQNDQTADTQVLVDNSEDDSWKRLADDAWTQVADESKPSISVVTANNINTERLKLRKWNKIEAAGEVAEDGELDTVTVPGGTDSDEKW